MAVDSNRLLYDKKTLKDVREGLAESGVPPKATEIKASVDTDAFVYEIRTALTYWFGGRMDHRESKRVWSNCEAVDNDEWTLTPDNRLVYADEVSL